MQDYVIDVRLDGEAIEGTFEALGDLLDRHVIDVYSGPLEGAGEWDLAFQVRAEDAQAAWSEGWSLIAQHFPNFASSLTEFRIRTGERFDADQLDDEFLGVKEVARALDVTPQRVSAMAKDLKRFPAPCAVLASGPVWRRSALDAFISEWPRRGGRPRSAVLSA